MRLLEIFRALMVAQTTVGAARSLQISQPAVSNAIRQMEESMGFPLFDRAGNRLVAREEARILFKESEAIFLLSHALEQTTEDLRENRLGHVRVIATPQLAHSVLPRVIQHFVAERPKVKVFLDVRPSYDVLDNVQVGSADLGLAIALETELAHTFEMLPIGTIEMVCVLPAGHPLADRQVITPSDILPYPMVGLEAGARLSTLVRNAFKEEGVPYSAAVEVRYSETACLLADAGVGITVVDWFSARANTLQSTGLHVIPFRPRISVDAWAILSRNRTPSRLASAFLEEVRHATQRLFSRYDTAPDGYPKTPHG